MKNQSIFRVSTLAERKEFYAREFNLKALKKWFVLRGTKPQLCALDAGSDTGLLFDKRNKGKMLYFHFRELKKMLKKYAPEDVYYDRNVYEDPNKVLETMKFNGIKSKELAFDVDADNLFCSHNRKEQICEKCLKEAFLWALRIKKTLTKDYDFRKIAAVYSGRGFHVHIFDKKAFYLGIEEREKINKRFQNFPIDPWVSRGNIMLIRMPYTLNALCSRIVMPISTDKWKSSRKYIPKFLEN